jgi:hybrid cluster-associated redox disulfide protein
MSIAATPDANLAELVRDFPMASYVLNEFGMRCEGCAVAPHESLAAGALAHGLRVEPIIAALSQARLSGRIPTIMNEDREPHRSSARRFLPKAVIAVMSGKGGVGKSLTTGMLAMGLRRAGKRVGILDADITGPSIPRLFGMRKSLDVYNDPNEVVPPGAKPRNLFVPALTRSAIEVVSSNLLTPEEDTAMIWRGPILSGVIRQFYEQTLWSELDILLVDLPPGTSDAPLTVLQSLSLDGVVLVTMPQALATMIVRKAANLVAQLKKPVIGVIENMSYFEAPDTGTRYEVFGPSHADEVATLAKAPMLARLPISPALMAIADAGKLDEFDSPIVDELAAAMLAGMAAKPKPKETISII